MALTWDCTPAKTCYDLGRARYTMEGQTTASRSAQDDEAIDLTGGSRLPKKVQFGWQQRSGSGDQSDSPKEGHSAQDICSYPDSSFGRSFAQPR